MKRKGLVTGPLIFYDRYTKKLETESVYGDRWMRLLYETKIGQKLSPILAKPLCSQLYGNYQSSSLSRAKIKNFIQKFHIKIDEYENGPFRSFNDFFIRKFKPGARTFDQNPHVMPAFCEGRYAGFESIDEATLFPVKGHFLKAEHLLEDKRLARSFEKGPALIARLCPIDYHRFHFPDDGSIVESRRIAGTLQSVNPIALKFKPSIFIENERHLSILETKNFGKLAYIEVGALCVGKIIQTSSMQPHSEFKRGEEKGYFLFGGSTVIVLGEAGAWSPCNDILENTKKDREVFIQLGDVAAHLIDS